MGRAAQMTPHRFLLLVLPWMCSLAAACSDDSTGPEGIQALFDLVYVDDQPLPVVGAPSGGCPVLIDHGSIALDTSGRFSAIIDAGTAQCPDGQSSRAYWPDAGTYRVIGDSIEFEPDGTSPAYSGRFVGGDPFVLELHHPRGTYTYFRFR
jgi:hypothetical protein